jgi:Uma2 family endonuclease
MQRKFHAYRDAGVREYWVLDGENKILTVYLFNGEQVITRAYNEKDAAPVSVVTGLIINLEPLFMNEE